MTFVRCRAQELDSMGGTQPAVQLPSRRPICCPAAREAAESAGKGTRHAWATGTLVAALSWPLLGLALPAPLRLHWTAPACPVPRTTESKSVGRAPIVPSNNRLAAFAAPIVGVAAAPRGRDEAARIQRLRVGGPQLTAQAAGGHHFVNQCSLLLTSMHPRMKLSASVSSALGSERALICGI